MEDEEERERSSIMDTMNRVLLDLRWRNSRLYWVACTENEHISVDADTYHRVLRERLAEQGIAWKSWTQYMQEGEERWKIQCAIKDALRADLDCWKQVPGVTISLSIDTSSDQTASGKK
jgi:hypothetical protein